MAMRSLDLGQAVLHGMARVIKNECPNVPLIVIDLENAPRRAIALLCDELLHTRRDRDESEIALRGEHRWFGSSSPSIGSRRSSRRAARNRGWAAPYRADLSEPGLLDQIGFRRLEAGEPGEEEVEIAVEAAALNFKDIMNAMGLLPANAVAGGLTGHRLGLEVAGRVAASAAGSITSSRAMR